MTPIAQTWWATVLLPCAAGGCPPATQPSLTAPPSPRAAALALGAGVIACGSARRDTKASDCVAMAGQGPKCLPRAERDDYARWGSDEDAVIDCDDDTDCLAGEHCCAGQCGGSTGPHIHVCTKDRCLEAIACVPATGCAPNLACRPIGSWADAHCEPAGTGVACDSAAAAPRRCAAGTVPRARGGVLRSRGARRLARARTKSWFDVGGARIVAATIAAFTWRGRPIARAPVRGLRSALRVCVSPTARQRGRAPAACCSAMTAVRTGAATAGSATSPGRSGFHAKDSDATVAMSAMRGR